MFVSEWDGEFYSTKMDHLVCFLPGTLALAATGGKLVAREQLSPVDRRDLELAVELTKACVFMYSQSVTGLTPEIVFWNEAKGDATLAYHTATDVDPWFIAKK